MEKGVFVKDIKLNTRVSAMFMVGESELAQSARGPYWRLKLSDSTGSIDANIWHPLSAKFRNIETGAIARAAGRVSSYRDRLQIAVEQFELLENQHASDIDISAFLPSSPYGADEMLAELEDACLREFSHQPWRRFVMDVLHEPEIRHALKVMPAAKKLHHAYAAGLLEHTLGVFRLCASLADLYPQLDRQTLLAGALFHDIGKIQEMSGGMANDYTTAGKLMGHIVLGLALLEPYLAKSTLEEGLRDHLRHLIASHHGELEYGAARLPQTAEAFALHYADNLDAKLAQCRSLFADVEPPSWSARQPSLDRSLFMPVRTPAAVPDNLQPQPCECSGGTFFEANPLPF